MVAVLVSSVTVASGVVDFGGRVGRLDGGVVRGRVGLGLGGPGKAET